MPVGASKNPGNVDYSERAPVLKYYEHVKSTCIFSSLAYDFVVSRGSLAEHEIASKIEESINLTETSYFTIIRFEKEVISDKA